MAELISVVIPTLDEGRTLASAIASIGPRHDVEVVVADGGSRDGTVELAAGIADTVVRTPRGRAVQLNAGAAAAHGRILLFLHADSKLPPEALDAMRAALTSAGTVGGAFPLQVDSDRAALRWISRGANLRSRLLGMPYGDQGLFARRPVFEALGGFRPLEIMEDVDFVRRLRRRGKVVLLGRALRTSDRRWTENGVLRTTAVNLGAALMFAAAVSPRRIRTFYDACLGSGKPRG